MELSVSAANAVFRNTTLFQTFFFGEGERDRMLLRWKGEVSVAFNSMEDGVFFFYLIHLPPPTPTPPPLPFLPSFGYLGFLIGLGIHIILVECRKPLYRVKVVVIRRGE